MRVIVLGLGGVGAMAAWRLAAAGHEVTALEQFRVDHDRGSSYGDSRIVRRVYPDVLYTRMMADAYDMWAKLMADSGDAGIFNQCGGLFFGPADSADVVAAESALRASGVAYERLDAREAMRRFPAFRLESSEAALYEPSMGYTRASQAVRAAVDLARRLGAAIREECRVVAVESGAEIVSVRLATGERLEADRLIVAAGPWAAPLMSTLGIHLPVIVTRQAYVHLEPSRDAELFLTGRFPVWIDAGANAYGFPQMDGVAGVKIGIHDYGELCTPETVDRVLRDTDREAARSYAARRFPLLGPMISVEKVCLYTVTPDNDFVIDALPGHERVILVSACSGHGFKFTPLLGQIATDIAGAHVPNIDLTRFRLTRFAGND